MPVALRLYAHLFGYSVGKRGSLRQNWSESFLVVVVVVRDTVFEQVRLSAVAQSWATKQGARKWKSPTCSVRRRRSLMTSSDTGGARLSGGRSQALHRIPKVGDLGPAIVAALLHD